MYTVLLNAQILMDLQHFSKRNYCRYPRDVYRTFLRRSNSAILYHLTSLVEKYFLREEHL